MERAFEVTFRFSSKETTQRDAETMPASDIQLSSASASAGVQNTEKLMKAGVGRSSAFTVSSTSFLIRIFDQAHQRTKNSH